MYEYSKLTSLIIITVVLIIMVAPIIYGVKIEQSKKMILKILYKQNALKLEEIIEHSNNQLNPTYTESLLEILESEGMVSKNLAEGPGKNYRYLLTKIGRRRFNKNTA